MRLALALALLLAGATSARAAVPDPVPLNTGWTFSLAGGAPRPVTLPHVMEPDPLAATFGGTTGTYRLRFTAPAAPAGFGWALRFEQVRRVATVTLNGRVLGTHRDPYVPFTLPASSLRPGARNDLVVAVDNRKGPEPREGWWNWGGITRTVSLVPVGPVGLRDGAVLGDVRCSGPGRCAARAVVDGWLRNRTARTVRPTVALLLRPPGDGAAIRRTYRGAGLAPGASRHVRFSVAVAQPRLWSPDAPQRYTAQIETRLGAEVAQRDVLRPGLRSVAVRAGRLLLNGREVHLRGASIQEDVPGRGPALQDSDMDQIVAELKALGANVTRAHYGLNPGLLDRLDAAGILVWTQAPIYHRDVLLRTPRQRARALATLRDTVLAARTHPSVLTYSVANELNATPDGLPGTADYLRAAPGVVRAVDPTLPVSVDMLAYPKTPKQRAYAGYDLLGVNSYYGWYKGKADRPVTHLAGLAPFLRATRRDYPGKALVLTEFGAEATEHGPASRKQTYAFQADYVRRTLDVVRAVGFVDGAIYWTLREFAVKPYWDGGADRTDIRTDAIHNKGLIAYDGTFKPAWSEARRLFARTPLYAARTTVVRARAGAGGSPPLDAAVGAGAVVALVALLAFDVWCFAGIRAERRDRRLTA